MKLLRLLALVFSLVGFGHGLFAASRTFAITAPSAVAAGQFLAIPCTASTDFGGGEQLGYFHLEYSLNGGASWTGVCYDANVGPSALRSAGITAGAVGTTIIVRARVAYSGGAAGSVDCNGTAIDFATAWPNWARPPAKYAYIAVTSTSNNPPFSKIRAQATTLPLGQSFLFFTDAKDPYDGNLVSTQGYVRGPGSYSPASPWGTWTTLFSSSYAATTANTGSTAYLPAAIGAYNYCGAATDAVGAVSYGSLNVWADWNTWVDPSSSVSVGAFTVTQAAPAGFFSAKTLGTPRTLTTGDLNATFANPYTGSVSAPTGTVAYAIAPGSPTGTPGTALSAGSVLTTGNYLIRASSPGDANYAAATADTRFAIGTTLPTNASPLSRIRASATTLAFGQTMQLHVDSTDADGNVNNFAGYIRFPGNTAISPWGSWTQILNSTLTAANTHTALLHYQPAAAGLYNFCGITTDASAYPSYGRLDAAADWNTWSNPSGTAGIGNVSFGTFTVNKATPEGTFQAKSFTGSRTVTAGDLNATFTNPYSYVVAAPTGTATYTILNAYGSGSSPTSGSITAGTVLTPGYYTIRASYPGDSNYNSTTVDALFTVSNILPSVVLTANKTTAIVTETVTLTVSGSDPDGNLRAVNLWVYTPTSGIWRNIRADSSLNASMIENNTTDNAVNSGGANVTTLGPVARTFVFTLNEGFGTYQFAARSIDANLGVSTTQQVNVTVANRLPTAALSIGTSTFAIGQLVTISVSGADADGDLRAVNLWVNKSGSPTWRNICADNSLAAFVENNTTSNAISSGGANVATLGAASRTYRITEADGVGTLQFVARSIDSAPGVSPSQQVNITAIAATPTGALSPKTITNSHPLDGNDLNAIFTNPYSNTAATGTVSYSIVGTSGSYASPTSGTVSSGNTLAPGSYTIRATFAASSNYNQATVDATFTVNLDAAGDFDSDGMANSWESQYGLNPYSNGDTLLDPDGDGLTNVAEFNLGKNPTVYDQGTSTTGGAIPAGWASLATDADVTKAVGATAGELNVDKSGTLGYSIPLWTTPGSSGMEPKFSLNYSSQSGPGIAGFGWSLSGLSTITRGGQSKAIDGQNLGATLTGSDRFYLDGQRLILISGTYGAAGSEYRTELESFTKVVAYGTAGSGPAYFKAWTKAGLIIEFGNTTDSARATGDVTRPEKIYWNVNRISDTKGNYMDFVYAQDTAAGTHLLTRIDYTGNATAAVTPYASLNFTYEDRPDWTKGYAFGAPVANTKRLTTVVSKYGTSVARTYTLGYYNRQQQSATTRCLLTSLTEAGADSKAYPALTFAYENPTGGWSTSGYFNSPAFPYLALPSGFLLAEQAKSTGAGFIDVDADGYPDLVRKKMSNTGPINNDLYLNKPAGWTAAPSAMLLPGSGVTLAWDNVADIGARMIDVDGDGLVDAEFANWNASYATHNTGSAWDSNVISPLPSGFKFSTAQNIPDSGRRIVDINADGLPDVIWNLSNTDKGCYINNTNGHYQSGGPAWVSAAQWAPPFAIMYDETSGAHFFDVNGDGLPDLVQMGYGVPLEAGVALNSPTGWSTWAKSTFPIGTSYSAIKSTLGAVGKYLPPAFLAKEGAANSYSSSPIGSEMVDLNGDGLLDIIFSNPKLAANVAIDVSLRTAGAWLNTGNGWVPSTEFAPPTGVALVGRNPGNDTDPTGAALTDLNADGLPDIAIYRADQTSYCWYNSGHGWVNDFAVGFSYNLPTPIINTVFANPTGFQFLDLNADGMVDLVSNTDTRYNLTNPKTDKLIKVTNGLGVSASIDYALLTERDSNGNYTVYSKGTGTAYPQADAIGPMLVVKMVRNDDGTFAPVTGLPNQYDVTYKYAGLRTDKLRGSVGFQKTTITDSRTGIVSETTYAQTYPFIGMPVYATTKNGTALLSESSVAYDQILLNSGKTRFVFATSSTSTSWDLNTPTTKTGETDTDILPADIDGFGNILKVTVATTALPSTATFFTKVTTSTYDNDATNWFLGRLRTAAVTSSAPGVADITRTSAYTYDAATGLLLTEKVQAGDATMELTSTYGYDAFGNKASVTTSGANLTVDSAGNYSAGTAVSRTTSTQYDANGRFPIWTRNGLNHQEDYIGFDQTLGVVTNMLGANSLGTSWTYDGMGRKIQEYRADGTSSYTRYKWASAATKTSFPGVLYSVESETSGSAPSLAFFDNFGRAIFGLGINGDGKIVYQRTEYDATGRAYRKSNPYYNDGSPKYYTETTSYDLLNRPRTVTTPDVENGSASTTTMSYSGLSASTTDPKSRISSTAKNAAGWTTANTRNETALGGATASTVTYAYDALGNLTTTVAAGVTTTLNYDIRGRKTSMIDADMGTWQYRYNIFGELIWQKDAKGQIVTMLYDTLGRMTSRTELEGTTTWTYDTSPKGAGVWKGKLHTVSAPGNYAESYTYDALGRPSASSRTIDGTAYTASGTYDNFGRPLLNVYPATGLSTNPFTTVNVYNAFGFLKEIRDYYSTQLNPAQNGKVFWEADSFDVSGRINGEYFGNGLANDRVFSASTGRLLRATIDQGKNITGPYFLQDLNYAYDRMGNVKTRFDYAPGVNRTEYFSQVGGADGYDGLDRLLIHRVAGGDTVTATFDAMGNITSKSDAGGAYVFPLKLTS